MLAYRRVPAHVLLVACAALGLLALSSTPGQSDEKPTCGLSHAEPPDSAGPEEVLKSLHPNALGGGPGRSVWFNNGVHLRGA